MTIKCSMCYEGEVKHHTQGYLLRCDACRAANLCYFCKTAPAVHDKENPRTTVRYPTCDACWDEQVKLGVASQGFKFGCLAIIALAIGAVILAVRSC